MTNINYKKITSPYVQKYTIAPPIPNNIVFYNDIEGKKVEVLRITKDGIMANPNVPVDEAAEAVIRALDGYIKNLTQRTWVELTDEEIKSCWNWETDCQEWAIEFARAILRKAREK